MLLILFSTAFNNNALARKAGSTFVESPMADERQLLVETAAADSSLTAVVTTGILLRCAELRLSSGAEQLLSLCQKEIADGNAETARFHRAFQQDN